jgi:hypothetical protein
MTRAHLRGIAFPEGGGKREKSRETQNKQDISCLFYLEARESGELLNLVGSESNLVKCYKNDITGALQRQHIYRHRHRILSDSISGLSSNEGNDVTALCE